MTRNLGNTDRLVRMVLGTGMIFGGIAKTGGLGCIFTIVGLVILISGMIGHCGIYSIFGLNSCAVRPQPKS